MYGQFNKLLDETSPQVSVTETITVPGVEARYGFYTHRLKYKPDQSITVVLSGSPAGSANTYTEISTVPTASGEIYINYATGDVEWSNPDEGGSCTISYRSKGSLVQVEDINPLYVWSALRGLYIPGIPAIQTTSGGMWSVPLHSSMIPGGPDRYTDKISIKRMTMFCGDLDYKIASPKNTKIVATTLRDNVASLFSEGVNGVSCTLTQPNLAANLNEEGWRTSNVFSDPWVVDLTAEDVWINLFRIPTGSGEADHGNITVELMGL